MLIETADELVHNIRGKKVNIYKHAFTFWHSPDIEPGTFLSHVGHSTTIPLPPVTEQSCWVCPRIENDSSHHGGAASDEYSASIYRLPRFSAACLAHRFSRWPTLLYNRPTGRPRLLLTAAASCSLLDAVSRTRSSSNSPQLQQLAACVQQLRVLSRKL